MIHRKNKKRAEVEFKYKFQQSQQSALENLCKYILIVFLFFTLMYVIMLSVSSLPLGNPKFTPSDVSLSEGMDTISESKPKVDANKVIEPPKTQENTKHPSNDYIIFPNYMARQVNGVSKGLFEKFEARHEHNLVQLYCDSLHDQCIGYAFNKNGGYQFYSAKAWPMQQKPGWDFYMKQDPNKPLILNGRGVDANDMDDVSKQKYAGFVTDIDDNKNVPKLINQEMSKSDKGEVKTVETFAKKKYISYAQNVGRVNNQLVSFEAMIQYALYYNRTLVIPWPRHRNHVMGFECGLWDFDRLQEIIDIIIEDQLPDHLKDYRNESAVPKECRFIKLVGTAITKQSNTECEMIYLYEGDMGIFHFMDGPKDVMKYIIPAKYIRDAVEDFLKAEFGELRYRIGVHRRAMREGGVENGEVHVCRWISRGIQGDTRFEWLRQKIKRVATGDDALYDKIIGVYHHSCAMDFNDLQNILIFHKQETIQNNEKFFIAHDHQEEYVIFDMEQYGGIQQPRSRRHEKYSSFFWSKSENAFKIHKAKCKEYGHCSQQDILRLKEEILFDMWALYYADFLAGTWMSTLTRTICHWKGFEKSIYNGNQCWLKWKWQDTVDGVNTDWYTLDGINETALFD